MTGSHPGTLIQRARTPWVNTVTADAIRHFAWGVGDNNPLWVDPDYARASCWADVIAPQALLYAVDETTVAPGLSGRRRVLASVSWVWWDVVRAGTDVRAEAYLIDESLLDDDPIQLGRVEFFADTGELIAVAETRCVRPAIPRPAVTERPEVRYSPEQLAGIEEAVLSEQRRGAAVRFWEDLNVGDDIGVVTKGPLSIMDVVAWCAATQGVAVEDDQFSEGGLNAECATMPQQVAWMSHLLTDWMGDDAFLHRLAVEFSSNPPLGSTTIVSGQVRELVETNGSPMAVIELIATSQGGDVTARGEAVVVLRSLSQGPLVLPRRPQK